MCTKARYYTLKDLTSKCRSKSFMQEDPLRRKLPKADNLLKIIPEGMVRRHRKQVILEVVAKESSKYLGMLQIVNQVVIIVRGFQD